MHHRVLQLLATCCVVAIGSSVPAASSLGSTGPLSITLDGKHGRVTRVSVGGFSVTDPRVAGGFSYRSGNSGPFRALSGPVSGQVLRASDGDLSLRATVAQSPRMTRIDGRLTRPGANVDLGLQLRFRLPIKATGWTYWEDLRRFRTIDSASTRYAFEGPLKYQLPRQTAYYPLIALSPMDLPFGVCLAIPMDSPNVFRLAYQEGEGLYVDFDLGLHSAQQGGPHADFSLVIYSFPAAWGMRAALQGYYDRFPQFFITRISAEREGTWFYAVDTDHIGNAADFNLAFDEHARGRWAWDAQHQAYAMEYSEPWNYYDGWHPYGEAGPHPEPSYDEMLAHLKQGLTSPEARIRDGSRAALASAIVGKDGKLLTDLRYWANDGYWYAIFHTILHPDLADGMQRWMLAYEFRPALEDSKKAGAPLTGWYLDSVDLSGPDEDYSIAHFSLPGMRLSSTWEEDRATLLGYLADYQWVKQFSQTLHAEGRILFGNGVAGGLDESKVSFYAPFFDAIGIESSLKRYVGRGEPRPADYCDGETLLTRAMMYRKPISTLYYDDKDSFDSNWRQALFYGIHDGPHFVWTDPKQIEAYRPVARHYIPILKQLISAGWCPVTYARSAEVWLERFGGERSGPLFLTVRNPGASSVQCTIDLDLSEAGLDGSVAPTAHELLSGQRVSVSPSKHMARLALEVAPEDTKVLGFSLVKHGAER